MFVQCQENGRIFNIHLSKRSISLFWGDISYHLALFQAVLGTCGHSEQQFVIGDLVHYQYFTLIASHKKPKEKREFRIENQHFSLFGFQINFFSLSVIAYCNGKCLFWVYCTFSMHFDLALTFLLHFLEIFIF